VAALVVGVLTMHATLVLCPPHPAGGDPSAVSTPNQTATVLTGEHDEGNDCGTHHALAACMAILGVGLLLAALRLLCRLLVATTPRIRAVLEVPAAASRAPPRQTANRLADLCVSRR
jgi:Family of unknown function (DUF6153)